MQLSGRGVAMSFFASCVFTIVPGYVLLLAPLDGVQVFAQRVLWSLPAVFVLLLMVGRGPELKKNLQRLTREPLLVLAYRLRRVCTRLWSKLKTSSFNLLFRK